VPSGRRKRRWADGTHARFKADRGGQPAEEHPAGREEAPRAGQHRVELGVVAREVQDGAAEDDGGPGVRQRRAFDRLDAEVRGRKLGGEMAGEQAHFLDRVRIGIDRVDVESGAKHVDQVPSRSAAGLDDPIAPRDPAPEELIEDVDVDRAELSLEVHHSK
jgi:hypothetical protein